MGYPLCNVIINLVPFSRSLSNVISPSKISMYLPTICRPKPVPCILVTLVPLKKRSNKCSWSSPEMPMPLSFTRTTIVVFDIVLFTSIKLPSAENFIALDSRFVMILRNRAASEKIISSPVCRYSNCWLFFAMAYISLQSKVIISLILNSAL